jgi:hypothetical protein
MDAHITKLLRKFEKTKDPRALNKLYSYRSPISRNIHQYLTLLGLDKKPPPPKFLPQYKQITETGRCSGRYYIPRFCTLDR